MTVPQEFPAPLRENEIQSGVSTRRIGTTIHLFQEVESTNDEAAALAGRGEAEGTIVIAERQRRGAVGWVVDGNRQQGWGCISPSS